MDFRMLVELYSDFVSVTDPQLASLYLQLVVFAFFIVVIKRYATFLEISLVLGLLSVLEILNCNNCWLELGHVI